ncbi:Polysaccharide pyruvyl transferase [Polaribacter sp. KT25b]|uniref:polysaccharide pyruvyl transferase family protein n=1 Tax=Polaribacter sp. KT25b TaxID=1855336 RepID=UPI00087BCBB5|nr:polysaccharide pyruvyl transferase family protein [Polaribacter sp. KT25b]SDS26725.1 Polysaccharide pyruvyl transferase [Polaribacter sp. KT25b]
MKIGILTLPIHINYGGILQAYALMQVLKNMGHDPILIDEYKSFYLPIKKRPKEYSKRFIKKYLLQNKDVNVFQERNRRRELLITGRNIKYFNDIYLQPKIPVKKLKELKDKDFDAFVVGSDQIWRSKYYPRIEDAFFNFAKNWNVKRLSYAPSFGAGSWEYSDEQTKKCKKLLGKFDAISVREDIGVELVSKFLDNTATHVLDPTMLLSKSNYIEILKQRKSEVKAKDIFVYVLDPNEITDKVIDKLSDKYGYKPFFTSTDNQKVSIENRKASSVEDWLRSFYEAKYVVTDSFHATAFSIIFNKPFVSYCNKERGAARFKSLLKEFNLEHRMVVDKKDLDNSELLNKEVDWDSVNNILEKRIFQCKKFIEEGLNDE